MPFSSPSVLGPSEEDLHLTFWMVRCLTAVKPFYFSLSYEDTTLANVRNWLLLYDVITTKYSMLQRLSLERMDELNFNLEGEEKHSSNKPVVPPVRTRPTGVCSLLNFTRAHTYKRKGFAYLFISRT